MSYKLEKVKELFPLREMVTINEQAHIGNWTQKLSNKLVVLGLQLTMIKLDKDTDWKLEIKELINN